MKQVKLYGKTQRFKEDELKVILTEKLDGSNLVLFKKEGHLHIAQRRYVFGLDELDQVGYAGLKEWLIEHGADLEEQLHDDAAIVGEWMGMSRYKKHFEQPFQMFAKANISPQFELVNLKYEDEFFKYPFIDQVIPSYIGQVPVIGCYDRFLSTKELDDLYEAYLKTVDRPVEGFVMNVFGNIRKYVRNKRGRIVPHMESYPEQNQKEVQKA